MAGRPSGKSGSKPASKAGSKKKKSHELHHQPQMKIVTSDTCEICPTQCRRGINYLEKMAKPGAIGFGVPCILTLK